MSGSLVNKGAMARNFSGAAKRYEAWATAQAQIAAALVKRLPAKLGPGVMVDLGCGTGLLAAGLLARYPAGAVVGIDLAKGMIEHASHRYRDDPRLRFVCGDAEDTGLLVAGAALVACASSSQWFHDARGTLTMWADSLASGGVLAVASLIQGSCAELAESYAIAAERPFAGLRFPPASLLPHMAVDANLRIISCDQVSVQTQYRNANEALRSFRQIGAVIQGHAADTRLTPWQTRRLICAYRQHATADGRAPVTYQVQYLIAEKRP